MHKPGAIHFFLNILVYSEVWDWNAVSPFTGWAIPTMLVQLLEWVNFEH